MIPIGGIRRPVTITDCSGQEVSITGGKLDVNATVSVAGVNPEAFTFAQDFSAPVDETDAIAKVKKALYMALALGDGAGGGLTAEKVLNVIWKSADGAAYDVALIVNETLPVGLKNKWFSFPPDMFLRVLDHIEITITAPGGADTDTVAGTLMYGT